MKQRHKDPTFKYPDFVCMKALMPHDLHAKLITEQTEHHEQGKKLSMNDLLVKIVRERYEAN